MAGGDIQNSWPYYSTDRPDCQTNVPKKKSGPRGRRGDRTLQGGHHGLVVGLWGAQAGVVEARQGDRPVGGVPQGGEEGDQGGGQNGEGVVGDGGEGGLQSQQPVHAQGEVQLEKPEIPEGGQLYHKYGIVLDGTEELDELAERVILILSVLYEVIEQKYPLAREFAGKQEK